MGELELPQLPEVGSRWIHKEDPRDTIEVIGIDLAPDGLTYIVFKDLDKFGYRWNFPRAAFFETFESTQKAEKAEKPLIRYIVTWLFQLNDNGKWYHGASYQDATSKGEAAFKAGLDFAPSRDVPRKNFKVSKWKVL